jgi:hypothetical protein
MRDFIAALPDIYREHVIDPGRQPQFAVLVAFLVTFVVVRLITYSIRQGWHIPGIRNVSAGGTHIHHLVPGIFLLLVSGYLGAALDPDRREIVALIFGIGAALTLDEFALWLHLEDVYWSEKGRISIDAVIITGTILGIFALGFGFVLDVAREAYRDILWG